MSLPQGLKEDPNAVKKHYGSGVINENTLQEYLELNATIVSGSANALLFNAKKKELKELERKRDDAKKRLEVLLQEVDNIKLAKEHAEYLHVQNPNVQCMLQQRGQDAAAVLSKEENDYMQALNKKEMCETEVASYESKIEELSRAMTQYSEAAASVESASQRQEAILSDIFDGDYGSEKEQQLEAELDALHLKRYRIHLADYNWRYARMFLYHTVIQMATGVKRWVDLTRIPFNQMYQQLRLQVVNEARANFLAALHNLQATQSILSHVTFPYCLPPEVQTLQIAVSYIYTDMLTNKRYQHAFECYRSIHLRSAALLQWFDKVITEAIATDKVTIDPLVKDKSRELKIERILLIAQKMQQLLGKEVNVDELICSAEATEDDLSDPLPEHSFNGSGTVGQNGSVFTVDHNVEQEQVLDQQVNQAASSNVQNEISDLARQEGGVPVLTAAAAAAALTSVERPEKEPPKRPLNEIAARPSNDVIFGNTDAMLAEFGNVTDVHAKNESDARAQMEDGLKKKLAQRKQRSQRMRMAAATAAI